jgi:chromosome segregation ATPase
VSLPDVTRLAGEVVPRDDFGIQARAPECRRWESSQSNNIAAAALEVASELAAAIRELEHQSAQAVARARDRANSIVKQLESEKARAARAEAAAQELSAALARTRSDLEITRRQLANKSEQLSQTEDRLRLADAEASAAQQRRMEANAKSEQIVEAIRTQLRSRKNLPAPN